MRETPVGVIHIADTPRHVLHPLPGLIIGIGLPLPAIALHAEQMAGRIIGVAKAAHALGPMLLPAEDFAPGITVHRDGKTFGHGFFVHKS